MELSIKYTELYTSILEEHKKVFEKQDLKDQEYALNRIMVADRIFIMGVGREGLAIRGFAMRLMHLGKSVHWIWDDTTPNMKNTDLFLITNGSGEIGHIQYEGVTHECLITSWDRANNSMQVFFDEKYRLDINQKDLLSKLPNLYGSYFYQISDDWKVLQHEFDQIQGK